MWFYDDRMGRWVATALLLVACKAELGTDGVDAGARVDSNRNAAIDAAIDGIQPLGAWAMAMPVPGASDATVSEDDGTLSSNKLELYFKRADGGTNNNLYMMTRTSVSAAWSAPIEIGVLNSTGTEESPRLSPDDLTLYFGRDGQIYRSTRTAVGQSWNAATAVTALNTTAYEKWADVCSTGYVIVSRDNGANGQDLYEGTITGGAPNPIAISGFNTTSAEQGTLLSADCLNVYFQSNRDGQFNIYKASRTSVTVQWSNPTAMVDFNTTTYNEEDPWISTDERVFVFTSNSTGNKNLYYSTR